MATESTKIVYTINNGQFKGTQKVATISVPTPGSQTWAQALDATVAGVNVTANVIGLVLAAKSMRGSAAVYREIGLRLRTTERRIAEIGRTLAAGEVDVAPGEALAGEAAGAEMADAALAAVIAEGALDAAAAASIVPAVGWVAAASLALVGAVIEAGLVVHDIVSTHDAPVVSVIFINAVPNSTLRFTKASWDSSLHLVGGDTAASMLVDVAATSMTDAGALAYSWEVSGGQAGGTASVALNLGQGKPPTTADLTWSIDPATGDHHCKLVPVVNPGYLTALCFRQPYEHNGTTRYALLYLLLPSSDAVAHIARSDESGRPLVADTMWAATTYGSLIGRDSNTGGSHVEQVMFPVGDRSYVLRDLTLRIWLGGGNVPDITISVCEDGGRGAGAILETFQAALPPVGSGPVHLVSVVRPTLHAGLRYWITITAHDPMTTGWWAGSSVLPNDQGTHPLLYSVGGDPIP